VLLKDHAFTVSSRARLMRGLLFWVGDLKHTRLHLLTFKGNKNFLGQLLVCSLFLILSGSTQLIFSEIQSMLTLAS
jgi:hypothetical protein